MTADEIKTCEFVAFEKEYERVAAGYSFAHDASTLYTAHEASMSNFKKIRLRPSQKCACFACRSRFAADAIRDCDIIYEDDGDDTATCPFCGLDTVISESDAELTDELVADLNAVSGLSSITPKQ